MSPAILDLIEETALSVFLSIPRDVPYVVSRKNYEDLKSKKYPVHNLQPVSFLDRWQ